MELIDIASFRANFVVETNQEFEEDLWQQIQFNNNPNLLFQVQSACIRCSMINISQKTGNPYKYKWLSILAKYHNVNNMATFGILLQLDHNQSIVTTFKTDHLIHSQLMNIENEPKLYWLYTS